MKKRIISLLLASAMLLSLTSCGKEKEQKLDLENITLEDYIEKVDLPKNLTISIDPSAVEERKTAKVYENVELMDFDNETLKEKLLHNPVTKEDATSFASSISYVAETDTIRETVATYDDGEGNSEGGFIYTCANVSEKADVVDLLPQMPAELYYSSSYMNHLYDFYQSAEKTLDFASRNEIENTFLSLFENLGVSEIEVQEMVAYNFDALNNIYTYNENTHNRYHESQESEDPLLPQNYEEIYTRPQKDDETYVVLGRQLVNGIPIDNYWVSSSDEVRSGGQMIFFKYTADGLLEGYVEALIREPSPTDGTEVQIVDIPVVLEGVQEYYGEAILLEPHDIESIELVYRMFPSGLKPCWVVHVSYPLLIQDEADGQVLKEKEVKATDHLYFDAVTGNLLPESISPKVE